jgi:uncharacterized membrane protein YgcG
LQPYFSFLFLFAHLLSMIVPAVNPILYAWMNSAFREAFLRVLPLGWRLRKKLELMEMGTMGGMTTGGTGGGSSGKEENGGMNGGGSSRRMTTEAIIGRQSAEGVGRGGGKRKGRAER